MTWTARFFRAWGETMVRHRALVFVCCAVITGLAAHQALGMRVDNSIEVWLPEESPTRRSLDELEHTFGEQRVFQVVARGDVFSGTFLERLRALHGEIAELTLPAAGAVSAPKSASGPAHDDFFTDLPASVDRPGIERVTSLINVRKADAADGALHFDPLLEPWPQAQELAALKRRVLADSDLVGWVVGTRGHYAIVSAKVHLVQPSDEEAIFQRLSELIARHSQPGFELQLAGISALNAAQQILTLTDVARLIAATSLASVVLLSFLFRHPLGVLGPMLVVAQSVIWTIGFMAFLGRPLTIVTSMLPAFLLAIGTAECIHLQAVYGDYRRRGLNGREAVLRSFETCGAPIIFTGLTTMFGLLSLMWAVLGNIRDLGLLGGFGVFASLVLTLTLLPGLLTLHKSGKFGISTPHDQNGSYLDRLAHWCNHLSITRATETSGVNYARRNRTLVVAAVLTVAAVVGMTKLSANHDQLAWFPRDYPVRQAIETLNADVGRAANFALLLDARKPGGLADRAALLALARFNAYAKAYHTEDSGQQLVTGTTSVLELLRDAAKVMAVADSGSAGLPATQAGVNDMLTLLQNVASDDLRQLVTVDMSRAVIFIHVGWTNALAYGRLNDYLARGASDILGPYATGTMTGLSKGYFEIVKPVINDLVSSFATAGIVVTLLITVVLRDFKLGLLAMVPNLLPVAFMLGAMGWFGIPLDVSNLLIASVALGIVVDDTIHLLYQFKLDYERQGQVEHALRYAFDHAGSGVMAMSLILIPNFLLFSVAEMRNVQLVGTLMAATVFIAFVAELIVTPAVLRLAYRDRKPLLGEELATASAVAS
jgi:predicted RND superfamily exporter protein